MMDVTDDASVGLAVDTLFAAGPCDTVVNNAGSCDQAEFLLQSSDKQRAEMELNYWGALRVTRAVCKPRISAGNSPQSPPLRRSVAVEWPTAAKWFDGVVSLPVEYTAKELCNAIERAPRKHPGSPAYRVLLWLGRLFPGFMEARVGASTRHLWSKASSTASGPAVAPHDS